jgi:hypothetical protein
MNIVKLPYQGDRFLDEIQKEREQALTPKRRSLINYDIVEQALRDNAEEVKLVTTKSGDLWEAAPRSSVSPEQFWIWMENGEYDHDPEEEDD